MIIPVLSLIAVLLPAVLGGRLTRLADVRLRAVPLVVLTLSVQVVIFEVVSGPTWLLRVVHVATYVTAGLFLWSNRRIPGAWAMGLGTISNGMAITLNGGELPAGAWALRVAGLEPASGFTNSGVQAHPHVRFLGDIFPIPQSFPLSNVFSIGDVLVVFGVAYACLRICGTFWSQPWHDPAQATSSTTSSPTGLPRQPQGDHDMAVTPQPEVADTSDQVKRPDSHGL